MPNHIKNRLEIIATKEQLKEIFAKYNTHHKAALRSANDGSVVCEHKDEKYNIGWFDLRTGVFQKRNEPDVIGLPAEYEIEITPAVDIFPDFKKVIPPPDCDEYNDIPTQDAVKDSPNWWYTWNVNNWGSKWGGYTYTKEDDNVFLWETAWSPSIEIISVMAAQFPEIEMIYEFADEDTGSCTGRIHYKNGSQEEFFPDNHSKDAFDIAFKLRPEYAENYELVEGKYQYVDND